MVMFTTPIPPASLTVPPGSLARLTFNSLPWTPATLLGIAFDSHQEARLAPMRRDNRGHRAPALQRKVVHAFAERAQEWRLTTVVARRHVHLAQVIGLDVLQVT